MEVKAEDKGHRHGNFPNYYSFHPPQNRLLLLEQCGLMDYIRRGLSAVEIKSSPRKKARVDDNAAAAAGAAADAAAVEETSASITEKDDIIYYCDLGCNEGDLTMAMTQALRSNEQNNVRCLGLDIDATLIQRASNKFSRKQSDDKSERKEFMPVFKDCNLSSNDEHNKACSSFFADATKTQQEIIPREKFSLTTVFSTTMWIHIHSGDEGLTKFLERACGWTKKYLLIEPQHSGCYRKANARLRKLKRPEIDVSSERLKMRANIEAEIDKVVLGCGFRRVKLSEEAGEQGDDLRTAWNRTLQLYERVESD